MLVVHGEGLDTRLLKPVKLERQRRGPVHEPRDAIGEIIRQSTVGSPLLHAATEKHV